MTWRALKIMDSWTPLFSKIVDSSLWSEPDHVCKVFITLLAKKDADQVSRMTAYAIGKKCWPGDPEAEVRALDALQILSQPDTKRVEKQPHEGRRIKRVEDGWLVLNGRLYEDMMRAVSRKVYKARWAREHRKGKGPGSMEQINEKLIREAPEGTDHFKEDPAPYAA